MTMPIENMKMLIGKLNATCRRAAERAASLTLSRGHYEVDLEHLFLALLEEPASDLVALCRKFSVPPSGLQADLEQELARFKTGNTRTPVFSANLPALLEHAWLVASLEDPRARIRSAQLLLALLVEPRLAQLASRGSRLFARFEPDALKHRLGELTAGSEEAAAPAAAPGQAQALDPGLPANWGAATPALDRYTTDLTERARNGLLDPVIGRDAEIRQAIDILMRRRQNNPILTGEAGVGKTAVVEGLALKIAAGEVPGPLRDVALRVLDLGLLQAGASVKGEFESRLKGVIDEVQRSTVPVVLFIDEAHTMIGAGAQSGQNDAANLLKPALARGALRTVAATTWSEYKKYFEKDAALARRFQVVKVDEPDEDRAAAMLRVIVPLMEAHFRVRVLDEAVTEAVRLSARYISGRQLPDKAIGVLDTACARVALAQSADPAAIEQGAAELARLESEAMALQREAAAGAPHEARLGQLRTRSGELQAELAQLRQRQAAERAVIARIEVLRAELEGVAPEALAAASAAAPAAMPAKPRRRRGAATTASPRQSELDAARAELAALQADAPMVPMQVDGHVVAEVVAGWTGVPLGRMVKDEIRTVLNLRATLGERVVGQDHALEGLARRVRTARANLDDPNKPKGVFLFVGPSGVGKTETALALAEVLYGGERKLITVNMSEYQEAHTVSGLKGSPPGYVGYGEGGVLTEAVRRQPYSVVLLDEVEKAHPDVLELFYQVFDKGVLDDAEGREVDFRNCVIILTSNVASGQLMQACLNRPAADRPSLDALSELLRPALYKAFKPAFLGRLVVVPFYPLDDEVLARIVRLKLKRLGSRIAANHQARFTFDDAVVEAILARCTEVDTGARNIDHIVSGTLLPELAEAVLTRMAAGRSVERIKVGVAKGGRFKYGVE